MLADPPPELTRAVISVGPHDFSRHSWGRSRNVTEGYVRLDPARDDSAIRLPLLPTAHRFRAGCRIRVLVAGGSHPQYARNLGTAENPGTGTKLVPARHTVAAGSRLLLPVTDPR